MTNYIYIYIYTRNGNGDSFVEIFIEIFVDGVRMRGLFPVGMGIISSSCGDIRLEDILVISYIKFIFIIFLF